MKKIFFFLFFIYSVSTSAQVIDKRIIVNGIETVDRNNAFLDGDSLSFKIDRGVEKEMLEWKLGVELKNNSFKTLIEGVTTSTFGFTITPKLFEKNNHDYRRIEYENDSSVYYHTVIFLYNKTKLIDSLSILMNVLLEFPTPLRRPLFTAFCQEPAPMKPVFVRLLKMSNDC